MEASGLSLSACKTPHTFTLHLVQHQLCATGVWTAPASQAAAEGGHPEGVHSTCLAGRR